MTLAEVKAMIEPIQPERVVTAGASYQRASNKLAELASNLIDHAQKLAGAWGGATAPKAIAQMQQLHDTAVELANTSQGTASVLNWYGTTIQPWYKSQILNMNDTFGDKVTGFFTGTDPANTAAANQLAKLNARTVEAYNSIPPAANKNLPPLTGSYGVPGSGAGAAAGTGGGASSGGVGRWLTRRLHPGSPGFARQRRRWWRRRRRSGPGRRPGRPGDRHLPWQAVRLQSDPWGKHARRRPRHRRPGRRRPRPGPRRSWRSHLPRSGHRRARRRAVQWASRYPVSPSQVIRA